MKKINYTQQQRDAISSTASKLLIISVAGSGKTTTLVGRINRLLKNGMSPKRILVMTFTNKMAKELINKLPRLKWVGNFHSIGIKMINMFAEEAGLKPGINVVSEVERKDIMAEIRTLCNMSSYPYKKIEENIKNHLAGKRVLDYKFGVFIKLWEEYFAANNLIDFDSIERKWLELLNKNGKASKIMRRMFEHIIVDEYQDTSALEDLILRGMKSANICVVGDIFQNIYEFRGTTIDNILRFKEEADEVVAIQETFRIPQSQVGFVNKVLSLNNIGYDLQLVSNSKGKGHEIVVTTGETIAEDLRKKVLYYSKVYPLNEIMILCRTNYHVAQIRAMLADMPAETVRSDVGWFGTVGKIIVAYIKFMINTSNRYYTERFVRAISLMTGVEVQKCLSKSKFDKISLTEAILNREDVNSEILKQLLFIAKSQEMCMYDKIHAMFKLLDIDHILSWEEQLNYKLALKTCANSLDIFMKEESSDLGDIVHWLSTINTQDTMSQEKSIKIMTAHTSKGLEAQCVIIPWVMDNVYPHERGNFEEELRLFYVAITRNVKVLVLLQTGESIFLDGKNGT